MADRAMYFGADGSLHIGGHKNKTLDVIMTPQRVSLCDVIDGLERLGRGGSRAVTITFCDTQLWAETREKIACSIKILIKHTRRINHYMLISESSIGIYKDHD